jgi:hypothetical protein
MIESTLTILRDGPVRIHPCGQKSKTHFVLCSCGNEFLALRQNIISGHTKSCGCRKPPGYHGLQGTPIHNTWDSMIQRCCNPKNRHFSNYGARRISVCDEWRDFVAFYNWSMGHGWATGLELDRKENNGNYEPENCQWVTHTANNRNKRTNRPVTYRNQTKLIVEWSELTGLRYKTLQYRINNPEWSVERALITPPTGGEYAHLFRDVREQL